MLLCSRISHLRRVTSLSLTPVTSIDVPFNLLKSSQLIAIAADYATEIENAVGVESRHIYILQWSGVVFNSRIHRE